MSRFGFAPRASPSIGGRFRLLRAAAGLALACGALGACEGPVFTGGDAGLDAGAALDGGRGDGGEADASVDGGQPQDGGSDGGVDAGGDAGRDGGLDGGDDGGFRLNPNSLRAVALDSGVWVGAAIELSSLFAPDAAYRETLAREYNAITHENGLKWAQVHPAPNTFNFTAVDDSVDWARARGMAVKGHALVWHNQVPAYVADAGAVSQTAFRALMSSHIQAVVGHYQGRIRAWDVVNEAIEDGVDAGYRDSVFLQRLGTGYIADAFRAARAADPAAELIYNDYLNDDLGAKSTRVFNMVAGLRDAGVPIDAVGFQMHISVTSYESSGALTALAQNISRLRALGLKVNVSELDVRIHDIWSDPNRFLRQKAVYKAIASTCLASPACNGFSTWGFTDEHSWVYAFFGAPDAPLPFDAALAPKPAYDGLREAFEHR